MRFAPLLRLLKELKSHTVEFVPMLHVGPMATPGKDIQPAVSKQAEHEKGHVECTGTVVLAPGQ